MPSKYYGLRSIQSLLCKIIELGLDGQAVALEAGDNRQAARIKNLVRRIQDEVNDIERRLVLAKKALRSQGACEG